MSSNLPTVTIVTVCYNAQDSIRKTMESVLNQTYAAIEYLIIDGSSTDKTMDIVRSMQPAFLNKGILFHVISERDRGIYDAMNKGIRQASGKWINFMNAGDCFFAPDVLARTFENNPEETLLYGDVIYQKYFGDVLFKPRSIDSLRKKMAFCHQSVFMPARILKQYPFGLTYRIANDYKLFYDYYRRGGTFRYLGFPVAYFESENGLSSVNSLLAHKENAQICDDYFRTSWQIRYCFKYMGYHTKEFLHRVLPKSIVEPVRAWNYRRKMRRSIVRQNLRNVNNKVYGHKISPA